MNKVKNSNRVVGTRVAMHNLEYYLENEGCSRNIFISDFNLLCQIILRNCKLLRVLHVPLSKTKKISYKIVW